MDIGSDAEILAATSAFVAGRTAGEVLHALYHPATSDTDEALDALTALLPIEQIAVVRLLDRLNLSALPAVVILLATLRRIRTDEAWIHYNLSKHLSALIGVGVQEAKLPAIIHSLLALEGLKDTPGAHPLPVGVLARELASFAPREAIRRSMLAARNGDEIRAAPLVALGLEAIAGRPAIAQLLQLATELHLSADNIPNIPHATSLGSASGLRTTMIEPPRRVIFPAVHGDASHYIFSSAGREVALPGISVHTLEGGTFSIDASMRGLERHYGFDRNGDCVLDFANGADPFVAETVLECDEPVAVLDDRFSGVMNICHFLLDRVTRIALYERAWSRPGKFFLVDDFPYHRDIFTRLGLADRVIIPSSKRVSIRAPELLLSSNIAADFRHPAHYCADWAIEFLRRALGIEERPARPGRKLLISRADTRGRRILNWDEVLPVFGRHGFEIVELAGLSTEAQMALFREASQVVGVHGAGLTNILFAPRDCAVLEILPPLVAVHDYWLLASALGQHYSALIAEDPELPRPDYATWQHNAVYNERDIVLPADRLEAALAALDDATNAGPAGPGTEIAAASTRGGDDPAASDPTPNTEQFARAAIPEEKMTNTAAGDPAQNIPDRLPDLILCHCSNYTLEQVKPFFVSFLSLGETVKLCVFASAMDDRFYEFCTAHDIRIEPAVDRFDRRYHLQSARFFEYNAFLASYASRYRKIMITDVRDVFFQSNPFIIPFSHEVCFAAEDRIIADEVCNASWITDIYGKKIFDEICGETITCSGTTLGTASAMTAYITMMCQELSWRRYDYLTACDQGFHNYIAWKIRPGFARVDLEDRIFNTIGLTNSSRIEVVGDLVLVDGAAPPVIHQWDRHEKLKEFLRSSELFRTGEPRFEPFVEPVAKTPGGKPRDFWDVFRSYHAAATAGNHESARAHLDEAASFPAEQSLPALTDRARRRFLAGEISACWTDVEQGLGALHSPLARWFKKDLAYMGALCRYAMHENGADDLLHLIPQDDPRFDEKGLEGPTMAHLEADARSDSDLLIERYLAIKQRLHHNAISWPSLVESLDSEDIILQIGAMDGVKWDPLHAVITRLNSPGVLVEPIAEMFEALQRNYYQNTRLTFANVAIAESSGSQTIYRIPIDKIGSADWAMGMSTLRKPNAESVIAPMVVPETVRGLTFADFCQEFGVTRFNLLQIDTEGYDWRVLRQIDLRRFETCIVRLEYCHLPIEDRFSVIEHLEAAGLNASCDDMDLWAGKI